MDITMCTDDECPMRRKCLRFTAEPNKWQWVQKFKREGSFCEYYWEHKPKSNRDIFLEICDSFKEGM